MGDVVTFDFQTTLDLPAEKILQGAIEAKLELAIVIGMGPDGVYHASTTADIPEMIFRLEMFKRVLLDRAASE